VSTMSNVAEGFERGGGREFKRYFDHRQGIERRVALAAVRGPRRWLCRGAGVSELTDGGRGSIAYHQRTLGLGGSMGELKSPKSKVQSQKSKVDLDLRLSTLDF